ncbi:glycosyltransferase family 4 protein [Halosolutus gelatinilyticus]|uniref:glycosyltransferase family 4 protein n=1 Tax=Halosolutus gelatinilyticus TaxID=2931975 RepID=UPI001FF6A95B|nr:glycosyltransferase family 4 protein [Halosolutus gelatinilyticus]
MMSSQPELRGDYERISDLLLDRYPNVRRVGVLISTLDEAEGVASVVIPQLAELNEANISTSVYLFDYVTEVDSDVVSLGNDALSSRMRRAEYFVNPLRIGRSALELKDEDLLIVHQPILTIPAVLTQYLFDTPVVFVNHRSPVDEGAFLHPLHELASLSDTVVSVSKYSRDGFANRYGVTGPVIYNTVGGSYNENVDGSAVRRKHSLGDDPVILYVGRISPEKNIEKLISVYEYVLREFPDAVLLAVGRTDDRAYKERLDALAATSNGTVIMTGRVSEEELPQYYAAADVYATCSTLEGFNLTIVEAEQCGTPTVAFDIGPHAEVQSYGRTVEPRNLPAFADAVLELLRS